MSLAFARTLAASITALALIGPARAGTAPADRSTLSFEDNVTINTACFAQRKQGDGAFDRCARDQTAQLAAHPSPDRTALSGAVAAGIERDCRYLRPRGIAAYNDCLTTSVAAATTTASADGDGAASGEGDDEKLTATKLFAGPTEAKATPVAMSVAPLPRPSEVLAARPGHIERQALSPSDVYKKVQRAVYIVFAATSAGDARARNIAQGSAVAVGEHLLLTNCHVVKDRPEIRIVQDKVITPAELVAADVKGDRCLLKSSGPALEPVGGVRAYTDLAVGERVFAIGTPRGLERTLSEGLISALRHMPSRDLIQTSASITHGSSGGGLFDERGNLIGITTSGVEGTTLDFAIAASDFWE